MSWTSTCISQDGIEQVNGAHAGRQPPSNTQNNSGAQTRTPIDHTAGSVASQCGTQCGMIDRDGGSWLREDWLHVLCARGMRPLPTERLSHELQYEQYEMEHRAPGAARYLNGASAFFPGDCYPRQWQRTSAQTMSQARPSPLEYP